MAGVFKPGRKHFAHLYGICSKQIRYRTGPMGLKAIAAFKSPADKATKLLVKPHPGQGTPKTMRLIQEGGKSIVSDPANDRVRLEWSVTFSKKEAVSAKTASPSIHICSDRGCEFMG
jgi:hypothetical protein